MRITAVEVIFDGAVQSQHPEQQGDGCRHPPSPVDGLGVPLSTTDTSTLAPPRGQLATEQRRGAVPLIVIIAGCALVTGAMWSMTFVIPGLESVAPAALDEPLTSVVAGFVISHAVLGVGALCWAVIAGRVGAVSKGMSRLLIAGAVLCLTPLPARFLLLSIGVTVAMRRLSTAPAGHPATA